jgi:hypothetical protein
LKLRPVDTPAQTESKAVITVCIKSDKSSGEQASILPVKCRVLYHGISQLVGFIIRQLITQTGLPLPFPGFQVETAINGMDLFIV